MLMLFEIRNRIMFVSINEITLCNRETKTKQKTHTLLSK